MSNKTSDKNVISIEEDVKILKYIKNDFDWDLQHPNSRTERELQEAKKYSSAIDNILAELEQKDKRIQELEQALLKVKDKNTTLFITCRNSIPKQVVIDLIKKETIDISGFKCIAVEDLQELLGGENDRCN